MKVQELFEVKIDNIKGAGAVPYNQEVDYMGFKALMKPSKFLSLAAAISRNDATSVDGLKEFISQGGAIGSPWFYLTVPPEWDDGDMTKPARITGHEGRNRMMAVMELEGDHPIEVHFFLAKGLRARDITSDWMKSFTAHLQAERSTNVVAHPIEKVIR